MSENKPPDKDYQGSHDELCESVATDIGVGEVHSPCSCMERWYQRELAEANEWLAKWRRIAGEASETVGRLREEALSAKKETVAFDTCGLCGCLIAGKTRDIEVVPPK